MEIKFDSISTNKFFGWMAMIGFEVTPDKVMQSTGLKDKNGVEIFEGDVLTLKYPRDRRYTVTAKVISGLQISAMALKFEEAESVRRWDPRLNKYLPFIVPEGATTNEEDINKIVNCANCNKEIAYGNCFYSLQIHTGLFGLGYMVCPKCCEMEKVAERNRFK